MSHADDRPLPRAASISDALLAPLPDAVNRRYQIGPYAPEEDGEKRNDETGAGRGDDANARTGQTGRSSAPQGGRRLGKLGDDDAGEDLPAPRSDPPTQAWGLRFSDWKQVGKRTVREIGRDRVTSVAGGVTFFGLLALFPAITAFVSIYGYFADPAMINDHLSRLSAFMPDGAIEIIGGQVEAIASSPKSALSLAGIIGLLLALWSANGGMKAIIDALNVAWFREETRGFIKLNLVALAFTLGAMLMIVLMLTVIAVIPAIIALVPMPDSVATLVSTIRWPIMFGALIVALATLYRWGPNKDDTQLDFLSPGAVLAAVGLVLASYGFSFYASNFTDYNATYGSIGAAVALMMWLWIAAIVVLVGAELNSEVDRQLRALRGKPDRPATA
ncbi:MAG: YihY/virulence factor BrkB family protein [Paracoccus sp. (in: a-proteobacteria)]|nr:YihY/virulence factor BrkB family protein [Paracoccus sp. (in: a-proteobacteria)]